MKRYKGRGPLARGLKPLWKKTKLCFIGHSLDFRPFTEALQMPKGRCSRFIILEYTYIQNTFDDFKRIIWDFAEQLSDDIQYEQVKDAEAKQSLDQLREAVDANSIDALRSKSREFIDFYIKYQSQKDDRRIKRLG